MTNSSNQTSILMRRPLATFKWLKYLGIVSTALSLYIVVSFYYRYGDEIFPKALTIGQYIKLTLHSIGSMMSELIVPLLFFSGALLYRLVRLQNLSFLGALKRDLLIIIPFGIALWFYGAFFEEPIKRNFYTMIFEVQQLQPGEKLVQDPETYEQFEMANLTSFQTKIDTLNAQIQKTESRIKDQLMSPSAAGPYIEMLQNQQYRYRDEIRIIHFTPIYILLFLLFGMILGYLIPLHPAALTAILFVIGCIWYFTSFLEVTFSADASNRSWVLLGKIGVLLFVNLGLIILASRIHKRSQKEKNNFNIDQKITS